VGRVAVEEHVIAGVDLINEADRPARILLIARTAVAEIIGETVLADVRGGVKLE
jgi:hypothetical protein